MDMNMEEEVPWFDVLVRRPNDIDAHRRTTEQLPEPTEVYTSTYPQAGGDGEDIKVVLEGFRVDSEQTMISSGLSQWEASDYLCNYLVTDNEIENAGRLLELGSVWVVCSRHGRYASTVLTDGDTNTLQLLRKNVARNIDGGIISCQQLRWGEGRARAFRSRNPEVFDLIIGSDLLYTNRNCIGSLFDTVDQLLDRGQRGRFILAHNEEHFFPVEIISSAAAGKNLFCEVLKQEGQIHILCFRRARVWIVNSVVNELQAKITVLENENHKLKTGKGYLEDKCRRLDERCTVLRGDE
ncbi:hypothetical protein ACHAXR_001357, partial [Thalassiosira sp. AJA248-18]